ncbi:MAG: universal stress protein [Candidatus Rokuibacteriota bacterium]
MGSISLSVKRIRQPIKRILIPTDGSDAAYNSVLQGVRFAAMIRAEVVGLHAVDPKVHHEARAHAHGTPFSQIRDKHPDLAKQIDEYLQPFRQLTAISRIAINTTATVGDPAEVILQAADVLAVDAIVMGTGKTETLQKGFFAGSVARQVFVRSPVPVLVLPPDTQIQTEGADKETVEIAGEITTRPRVLVGVDAGHGSAELLAESVRFARALQAEVYFMFAGKDIPPEVKDLIDSLKESAKQYFLPVRDRIVSGDPVEEATRLAEVDSIDFFVFGTRLRLKKGLMAKLQERAVERGGFFGSTSDALVRKATRPVLIVHLGES